VLHLFKKTLGGIALRRNRHPNFIEEDSNLAGGFIHVVPRAYD
jgi:hypothetical protein